MPTQTEYPLIRYSTRSVPRNSVKKPAPCIPKESQGLNKKSLGVPRETLWIRYGDKVLKVPLLKEEVS